MHKLNFEVYIQIFKFYDMYYFVTIILHGCNRDNTSYTCLFLGLFLVEYSLNFFQKTNQFFYNLKNIIMLRFM
jgi:hypothetical protein